ncbi:MAG: ABC transporter permease, partial [Caldilineaceae bacterium]
MFRYIMRRIVSTIPVLFGVSILVFSFVHIIPGDPAVALLGERATEANVQAIRERMGLNDPMPVQYLRFLIGKSAIGFMGGDQVVTNEDGQRCVFVGGSPVCQVSPGTQWVDVNDANQTCNRVGPFLACHDGGVLWGDLGKSIHGNISVVEEFKRRFPATIELALAAMAIAVIIGVPAGVFSALYRNSPIDTTTMFAALAGVSMPIFWLGILLMWLFGLVL